jgi:hypothetical protein
LRCNAVLHERLSNRSPDLMSGAADASDVAFGPAMRASNNIGCSARTSLFANHSMLIRSFLIDSDRRRVLRGHSVQKNFALRRWRLETSLTEDSGNVVARFRCLNSYKQPQYLMRKILISSNVFEMCDKSAQ